MPYNEFREQAEMYYDNAVTKYNNGNFIGAYQDLTWLNVLQRKIT